jgi:hypothetical protein
MPSARRFARRRLIAAGAAVTVSLLLLAGATLPAVLDPESGTPSPSDVVFLHVGGRGERLDTSIALMNRGVAGVLVIPTRPTEEWPEAFDLCRSDGTFEVICLDSIPANTRDEALALDALVSEQGWQRVAIVTNDYHMARAAMLDRSCTDADLAPVPVEPSGLNPVSHGWKIFHEMIALPHSWLFQRCDR